MVRARVETINKRLMIIENMKFTPHQEILGVLDHQVGVQEFMVISAISCLGWLQSTEEKCYCVLTYCWSTATTAMSEASPIITLVVTSTIGWTKREALANLYC